ncbi:LysE/ArgO family amino acid transporter [Lacticaseibacillus thailandensis]|uniref:LysE/ArgO family amino acid transporter n=1 Tax=Lacticaseibacillus thailandensis TaxID=381741 RepID=UPI0006D1745F|nr:LysE family transporter [Lacticaseibacillus thailandensis]
MLAVYLRGMLISIALVSSIGMQNLFVFNSAMSNRLRRALLIAAFVWVADTTLTVVAFLGVGTIITHYQWLKLVILLVGGVVVIWMGWGILRSANATTLGGGDTAMPLKEAFTGAWVVAFANPQAIIDTSVSFGAMRSTLSNSQVLPFLLGILSSTALWFFWCHPNYRHTQEPTTTAVPVVDQHYFRRYCDGLWRDAGWTRGTDGGVRYFPGIFVRRE